MLIPDPVRDSGHRRRSTAHRVGGAAALAVVLVGSMVPVTGAWAAPAPAKTPVATGYGGAVASVDPDATNAGLKVLREGGNAVDAAVATAAALGVTEPYSAGIGGGGYFVYYDAKSRRVHTIDGREAAPRRFTSKTFTENGTALPFDDVVTSGLSNGVPGTPATWDAALKRWGKRSLAKNLAPATEVASRGFTVDQEFHDQTAANAARFKDFPATVKLFMPGGQAPKVGSTLRNADLARTYQQLGRQGTLPFYAGDIARDIVKTTQKPPVDPKTTRKVRAGLMTALDLLTYRALVKDPTKINYRGLDVYGMAPASSGGTTVGEALNILETQDLAKMTPARYFHSYIEASRYSFADRNRWVGDPRHVKVPTKELLSDGFAKERACLINPNKASSGVVKPGNPDGKYAGCPKPSGQPAKSSHDITHTTNLTTADRWGNVVEYTLTIEQTGGSGITVPGRGFLLNNELTDFNFVPVTPGVPDPNLPGAGKRPRSSMSPTIILKGGKPFFATGSPGGATIITTVLEIITGRVDRKLSLVDAIAAPRASQRNAAQTEGEPAFLAKYGAELRKLGHQFKSNPEIGAGTGIEFLPDGRLQAAAEKVRRHGGSAGVVRAG